MLQDNLCQCILYLPIFSVSSHTTSCLQCSLGNHSYSVCRRHHQVWPYLPRYPQLLQPRSWYIHDSYDWYIWNQCRRLQSYRWCLWWYSSWSMVKLRTGEKHFVVLSLLVTRPIHTKPHGSWLGTRGTSFNFNFNIVSHIFGKGVQKCIL